MLLRLGNFRGCGCELELHSSFISLLKKSTDTEKKKNLKFAVPTSAADEAKYDFPPISLNRGMEALFQAPSVLIEQQEVGSWPDGGAVIGHVWPETFSPASCAAPAAALPGRDELPGLQQDPSDEYSCGAARRVTPVSKKR